MSSLVAFPRSALNEQAFGEAASKLAGAVAIVTWQAGVPGGLLVRSVSLLSTRPARILFGVDKRHPGHDLLLHAETCTLNLLSEADEDEAARFERQRPAEFPPHRWRVQADHPPRFIASAIHLEGVVDHRIDAGSHSLFVVLIDAVEVNDRAPLIAFDRGFRRLAQPEAASA